MDFASSPITVVSAAGCAGHSAANASAAPIFTRRPAGRLPKVGARPVHQRVLPCAEVGAALAAVRRTGAAPAAKLAFECSLLCAAHSGEARGATKYEFDLARVVWTIPAVRMAGAARGPG